MRKVLAILMIVGAALLVAPRAYAACGAPVPMFHSATNLICADATEVAAVAYQLAAATTVNTGTENIACEIQDPAVNCLGGWGGFGDGIVGIETDWANPTILGCPVSATLGPQRVVIVVQAADGTGAVLSISGVTDEFGYQLDMAHTLDLSTFAVLPIACAPDAGKPMILSASTSSGVATLSLKFSPPRVYSDCDPASLGAQAFAMGITSKDACADHFSASPAVGRIYTLNATCGTRPDIRRPSWTLSAVTPAADGTATVQVTQPTTAGQCAFVGNSSNIGGLESGGITGFIQVPAQLAASPKALDVRAVQAKGGVAVTFRTDSEIGLASFTVWTESKGKGLLQVGTIAPKGNGGPASYSASFDMGAFKGGKNVIIEAIGTNGASLSKSDPVSF